MSLDKMTATDQVAATTKYNTMPEDAMSIQGFYTAVCLGAARRPCRVVRQWCAGATAGAGAGRPDGPVRPRHCADAWHLRPDLGSLARQLWPWAD